MFTTKCNGTDIEPLKLLQALTWHDMSPLKSYNFKIQAQDDNKVGLFEEMSNASVPSEKGHLYAQRLN